MLQLNPTVPVWIPKLREAGFAILVTDYSQEHDRVWTVLLNNGEVWDFKQSEIRGQENITFNRAKTP